jgi:hypothetical protein
MISILIILKNKDKLKINKKFAKFQKIFAKNLKNCLIF